VRDRRCHELEAKAIIRRCTFALEAEVAKLARICDSGSMKTKVMQQTKQSRTLSPGDGPRGSKKRSRKTYKGFPSYEAYYDEVILGPAENLYATLTAGSKAKNARKSSGRRRSSKTALR
jgi:hypothetical protein